MRSTLVKVTKFSNKNTFNRAFGNIKVEKNFRHSFDSSKFLLTIRRDYSETNLMKIDSQSSKVRRTTNDDDSSRRLAISEEFKVGLELKLKPSNFKTIAYKQDEFNQIMRKLENPFNLFYLFEKYAHEFSTQNLIALTNKMVFMKYNDVNFFIPAPIKTLLTKLVVKELPHFESFDCFVLFKKLDKLDFGLNESAIKACLQILKYHVNELELSDLLKIKYLLNRKTATDGNNEYTINLNKALSLAVQIKLEQVDNPTNGVRLLSLFADDLSPNNFDKLIKYLNLHFNKIERNEVLDLLKTLATKKYEHIGLFQKISKLFGKRETSTFEEFSKLKGRYKISDSETVNSNILTECAQYFLQLKFSEVEFLEYMCDNQLRYLKQVSRSSPENLNDMCEIIRVLLRSFYFFQHNREDFVDFLRDDTLKTHENFPRGDFLTYIGLIRYWRFVKSDIEKMLEGYKSANDEGEIELIKSLCWSEHQTEDLARSRLSELVSPESLSFENKLFIKDVFKVNYFKNDEKLPAKSKLEEQLERLISSYENGRYKVVPNNTSFQNLSYFINYTVIDQVEKKKFYLSLGRKNEYFRNVELSTGSWLFRRNFIHDLIVREGERTKLWIVNTKTLTNQPDEKIQKVIEKKIFKNSQDTHENKNDLFILLNNKD